MNRAQTPAADAGLVQLGDLTVNRMAFGAMRVAGAYVWGRPHDHPEPGTRSVTPLEENAAAARLKLSPEDLAELNKT